MKSEKQPRDDAGKLEIARPVRTLGNLPPELILQIVEFLPKIAAASFALCNRKLVSLFGLCTRDLLYKSEPKDRVHFLTILSRDLPGHYACHGCTRLHCNSFTALPSQHDVPAPPSSCVPLSARGGYSENGFIKISNYFSPYSLYFSHIQLALKRHRYGPSHGISLDDLSYTDIQYIDGTAYLFSVEARVVSHELVMRSQEWVLSSKHPYQEFSSKRQAHNVCQHLMTCNEDFGPDDSFTSIMQCRSSHKPAATEPRCRWMGLQQCKFCPMEYQIDFVDLEELGTAFCATKWLNLGSGLDFHDLRWQAHDSWQDPYIPHDLRLGSICSGYEYQEGLSADEMTAENI